MAPANPYAVSKAAGEQLCDVYASSYGLRIVRARPFSHSGPGQRPIFLLSSLARQAAEGRRDGAARLRIVTGNGDTRRDFTDVRDIVRAYRLLAAETGGGVYNVSSGRSMSAAEQVALLAELVAPIEVRARGRPGTGARPRGDGPARRPHAPDRPPPAGSPQIPFAQTMADTVAWWESELAGEAG